MQKMKRGSKCLLAILMSITCLFALLIPAVAASESKITIQTTLTDGMTLKGSKKTFDVIARQNGNKISSTVTLNDQPVNATWKDDTKDSYTLVFTEEGENIVRVTAGSGSQSQTATYRIQYEKAQKGERIGQAVFTLETLTLGTGFLVEPIQVPVYEGENGAQLLDRVLTEQGFAYSHTGRLESGFYLETVANGGHPRFKKGCQTEGATLDRISENPGNSVPAVLRKVLEDQGSWPLESAYYVEDGRVSALGEFDFTFMSGWMYAVNGIFPNVGFSDIYPSDGDVIRAQFTLYGYGADIGGGYAMGSSSADYYAVAQKDRLLTLIAAVNSSQEKDALLADPAVKAVFDKAMLAAEKLEASQDGVDSAAAALSAAVQAFRDDRQAAAAVDAAIDAIGAVTLDREAAIAAARAAYGALTELQQALVAKRDVLTAAEKELANLKATQAEKEAAAAVDAAIDVIGPVTLEREAAIAAARAAYDALTELQQALVAKRDVLTAAEKELANLKAAQAEKEAAAAALAQAKAGAKAALAGYKDAADYREAQRGELAAAVAAGEAAVDAAVDEAAVEAARKAAMAVIDKIPTDAQLAAGEAAANTALESKDTGLRIQMEDGRPFEAGVTLRVEDHTDRMTAAEEAAVEAAVKNIAKGRKLAASFDIRLLKNGAPYIPDGSMEVRIPITGRLLGYGSYMVVYIAPDGKTTVMDSRVENGYLLFVTDHNSTYAVLAGDSSETAESPATGDTAPAGAVVLTALAAAALAFMPKRRKAYAGE